MTRVNNFVENGGRLCRTLARSVSVDVDPNVQKKISKIFRFFSGGYPGFSQPAKTAYQHRERFEKAFNQMPVWGVFGVN